MAKRSLHPAARIACAVNSASHGRRDDFRSASAKPQGPDAQFDCRRTRAHGYREFRSEGFRQLAFERRSLFAEYELHAVEHLAANSMRQTGFRRSQHGAKIDHRNVHRSSTSRTHNRRS